MRRFISMAVTIAFLATARLVNADDPIPPGAYVQNSSGEVFFVTASGARQPVSFYPATDEQIAALPIESPAPSAQPSVAPPSAAPLPPTIEQPVTLSDVRGVNTRPFALAGGNYTARWTARPAESDSSCYFGATIQAVTRRTYERIVSADVDTKRPVSGETQIYRLPAGSDYFLDVNTHCVWEVTIAPQS